MTAVQVQTRRDTATNIAAATGAAGEVWVDTTNWRLVVNDGSTAGGWPVPKLSQTLTNYRTAVSDASYTIVPLTDRLVPYAALTAARVVTLCAASAYPQGTPLTIVDETGNCSATKTITITRAGSDTINGATSVVLAAPYGYCALESNGSNAWTVIDLSGPVSIINGGSGVSPKALPFTVAATAINANSVADTAIPIPLAPGFTRYAVRHVTALNPSISLTAAQAALYTAASAGGVAVCSPQALSGLTGSTAATAGNAVDLTQALAAATFFTNATMYFRITTAQGAAATLDVVIEIQPYD